MSFAAVGSSFVFGPIGVSRWTDIDAGARQGHGAEGRSSFQIAPTIIFIAALFAILYYFGVMQFVVRLFALVANKAMGAAVGVAECRGQHLHGTDGAPRRFVMPTHDSRSDDGDVGMAYISGGIMATHIAFGIEPKHLLTAVIMTAPGTLMMAKMFVRNSGARDAGTVRLESREPTSALSTPQPRNRRGLHLAMTSSPC